MLERSVKEIVFCFENLEQISIPVEDVEAYDVFVRLLRILALCLEVFQVYSCIAQLFVDGFVECVLHCESERC